ncbi:AraC family transcriptional regulator [Rhodohalobacter mucosus]|uniref:AraC family transcriptional regulator n=1 Tax=Rhodohalobacter mucosus TaxID=2079485 RepID=A0A316TVG5_9BACT|nr:helix-turn-helix domain-containing protein [Rhodohalobacter mucosus]PWN07918.1 AraC family transcriptional regulator [Rhodohalobacter mucosus]
MSSAFHSHYPPPQKLVENRTSFAGDDAVFSVYDTFQVANRVELRSTSPMYCGMISGKKVIHSGEEKSFEFVPSESLVLPPDQSIYIDFPDAKMDEPTKCITVELPLSRVNDIVARMNDMIPRSKASGNWEYDSAHSVHFKNTASVDLLIRKLFHIFTEEHKQRDLLVDLNTSELIVHMLQTESRALLLKNYRNHLTKNGLAAAIHYIHENLDGPISSDKLASVSCMSKASFYRYFKNEFGVSPVEYINKVRVEKACKLLVKNRMNVTDVGYELGFSSISHFIKLFKEHTGLTPKQYQLQNQSQNQNTQLPSD